jgi:homoserine kinase type II
MSIQFETTSQLSKEEIEPLLESHGLGTLKYIKSISKGIESSSYNLITENESYILTIFNDSLIDLTYMKETTNHFNNKEFPFAKILATGLISNKPAFISSHLSGKVKSSWTESDYKELGFFLGNFHKCSYFYKNSTKTLPFIWQFSNLFYKIKKHIPNEFLRLEQEIFLLEEEWPNDLPKGLIHGDIWPKNILFREDSISGVLDFNPTYDPYILDLANILKGIPKETPNSKEALLLGYELSRPLTPIEFKSLDLVIYAKIVASILYLLEKAVLHPKRKDEFQTYAFLNLIKLDSFV